MTAIYAGQLVTIVAYRAKGDRSQIAYRGMLRWVPTCKLVTTPELAMTPAAAALASSDEAAARAGITGSDERIPQ